MYTWIWRTLPGSMTKFWPSFFVGRTPSLPAMSRMSPAPSSRTPAGVFTGHRPAVNAETFLCGRR